jgi:hypothetical protein
MKMRNVLTIALAAVSLSAGAAVADMIGVSRCDQEVNGTFQPGLLTVDPDGTRVFHPVGENGLTETITFNRQQAFDWVEAQGLFPDGTVYANYDGYICGLPCEDCPADEPPEADLPNGTHEENTTEAVD